MRRAAAAHSGWGNSMRDLVTAVSIGFSALFGAFPAQSCAMLARMNFNDVKYADVVVIGKIANYAMVLDEAARRRHRDMIEMTPPSSKLRAMLESHRGGFISDYARFDILVDEVLVGKAPEILKVTWDNSTFGEPETLDPGPFIIALRRANSPMPPLRGPSATILPTPDPATLTVLQAPCSGAFLFPFPSNQANDIMEIVKASAK